MKSSTQKKWSARAKIIDHFFFSYDRLKLISNISDIIRVHPIQVADVGASGGADMKWQGLDGLTRFITFEPDARTTDSIQGKNVVNFPVGLSDKPGNRVLHLTRFPDASSLYPLNSEFLDHFANKECHEVVGNLPIALNTFDDCLLQHPEFSPDFMKVDAEGSDLDILKGSSLALSKSILGIRVEVSFQERYVGSPFFGETDAFLRNKGYFLFHLYREHWIRKNRVFGFNSRPQLIWGDAVYFLKRDVFFKRLESLPPSMQEALACKFVIILVLYGAHDYAFEIVDYLQKTNMLKSVTADDLFFSIRKSQMGGGLFIAKTFLLAFMAAGLLLVSLPSRRMREKTSIFVRKKLAMIVDLLSKPTRSGPNGACLSDFQ